MTWQSKASVIVGGAVLLGGVCVAFAGPIENILGETPTTLAGLGIAAGGAALRWAWWLSSKLARIEDRLDTLSADVSRLQGHAAPHSNENDHPSNPPARA